MGAVAVKDTHWTVAAHQTLQDCATFQTGTRVHTTYEIASKACSNCSTAGIHRLSTPARSCLLYTSDAADE